MKKALRAQEKAIAQKRALDLMRINRQSSRVQSQAIANVAKSGVTMSGSAALAVSESAEIAMIDQMAVMAGSQSQIDVARAGARSRIRASRASTGADILSGAARMLSSLDQAGWLGQDTTAASSYGVLQSDVAPSTYNFTASPSQFTARGPI